MATTKFGLNQLKFNKGSKIYAKGDKADFAYYVHVGKVNIYSPGGLLLGQIGEGEIFGEVGHIMSRPRTVTARAATKCIVKVIDDETLKTKLQEADPICLALIRGLAMRISDANEAAENYWRELSVYKSLQD